MLDDFYLQVYIREIENQIIQAEEKYSTIISNSGDCDLIFSSIHYFLIHVSHVVKLIQPNFKDDNDFRKYRALSIKSIYPNIPNMKPKDIHLRNDFEHFDERIDFWVINSKNHCFADKNIGETCMQQVIGGIDEKDSFRWYDSSKHVLYFCGANYNLERLYKYIQDVKNELSIKNQG